MRGPLGATLVARDRCEFRVWAPFVDRVDLHLVAPAEGRVGMAKDADGYHSATVDGQEGESYFYTVNGTDRPDPASRLQPEGVHGPSEVVGQDFAWHDEAWRGVALEDLIMY